MYRYDVDHAVTYTLDDVVLFRESPFAVWMERLTLENPDHGIPPDLDSVEPQGEGGRRYDLVATLRAEGRNVVQIDWDLDEPDRRTATLAAMRQGADFIVNGQLALGNLSGRINLLMRTSGYSDLGDFLYVPCEAESVNTFQSAFRLCFIADLLHSLQGQLPPQMLIIRDDAEVVPLRTEDYIHYFRAVQQRFLLAMTSFRKHRMPDPAESAHFGRWSGCASEVLKQRTLGEQQRADEKQTQEPREEEVVEMPQLRVASGSGAMRSQYDVEPVGLVGVAAVSPVSAALPESTTVPLESATTQHDAFGATLAEQAALLAAHRYRNSTAPGHTPNLARFGRPLAAATLPDKRDQEPNQQRRSSDAALQNLEFIGSNASEVAIPEVAIPQVAVSKVPIPGVAITIESIIPYGEVGKQAPAPTLREAPKAEDRIPEPVVTSSPVGLPELEPPPPVFLPPEHTFLVEPPRERMKLDPRDVESAHSGASSVIDMDTAPAPTLAPVVQRAEAEFARIGLKDPMFHRARAEQPQPRPLPEGRKPAVMPFSNSLITSRELNDC